MIIGELGEQVDWYQPIVVTRPSVVKVGDGSRVDSFVKIEGGEGVTIGRNVHIASFCHVNIGGGETIIEDGAAMASGAKIISGSNKPEGESCSASAPQDQQLVEKKRVVIRKNAILFAGAIVMPGVHVGERARIGAGAVVTKDVPAREIWAGVPARKIGEVS